MLWRFPKLEERFDGCTRTRLSDPPPLLYLLQAYGHGGTGMVITALTDNVNRAIADVKTVWKKHDVKQAAQGSVLFQFDKKGRIEVAGVADEEQVGKVEGCSLLALLRWFSSFGC